jgi:hypothetical protein
MTGGKGGAYGAADVRIKPMKNQLVIPSVERGTWVGGDAQDERRVVMLRLCEKPPKAAEEL